MNNIITGQIYIGSLKNDLRWPKYNTSSKTVKKMIIENPTHWDKVVLLSNFNEEITWAEVVSLEHSIIRAMIKKHGKNILLNKGIFNKGVRALPGGRLGTVCKESTKKLISLANKGNKSRTGQTWSEEQRTKVEEAWDENKRNEWSKKEKGKNTGEKNGMFGKPSPRKGVTGTTVKYPKNRKSSKGKVKFNKELKWFNNGQQNKRCIPGSEPSGFTKGRFKKGKT